MGSSTSRSPLAATPQLADEVTLDVLDEQHYLYNRATSVYALLDNTVAREIVRLIDGHRRVQDICEEVRKTFSGATSDRITADVLDMLAVLERESFLTLDATG